LRVAAFAILLAVTPQGTASAQTQDSLPSNTPASDPAADAYLDETARRLVLGLKAARDTARLTIDAYTALKAEGVNVKYMTPKEGAMTWVCGFCLMSAADPAKLEKSYDAIDAFLSPDSGVLSILDEGYGHSNMHAYELVPEQYLTERGLSSNPEEILSAGIFQEPIGNEAVLQEMFEEVKAGL